MHTPRRRDLELGPPELPADLAIEVARTHYGVEGEPRRLSGERDVNLLFGRGADARLLKIASADEPDTAVDMQIDALLHLAETDPELPVPRVVRTLDGAPSARVEVDGANHMVRMLTYVPGAPFDGDPTIGVAALDSIGAIVARLAADLAGFEHDGADRFLPWDISSGVLSMEALWATLDPDAHELASPHRRRLLEEALPGLAAQRVQVIHSDAHAGNVLRRPGSHEVSGIIDFGDSLRAPLVNELAVCVSGFIRNDALTPIESATALATGFHQVNPLHAAEVELLYDAVLARLVLTLLLFDHQISRRTGHADYCRRARSDALDDLADWLDHDPASATHSFFEGIAP